MTTVWTSQYYTAKCATHEFHATNFSYHFYMNYIWISCENIFMSFWHEKIHMKSMRNFFVSFSHENILMWIWCENFSHQIRIIRSWYFMQIINFTWKNVEKFCTTCEKNFVRIWHENDRKTMRIFSHELHALLDLLLKMLFENVRMRFVSISYEFYAVYIQIYIVLPL